MKKEAMACKVIHTDNTPLTAGLREQLRRDQ
jgi:hypothetical protein